MTCGRKAAFDCSHGSPSHEENDDNSPPPPGFAFFIFSYPPSIVVWKQMILLLMDPQKTSRSQTSTKPLTSRRLITDAFCHLTPSLGEG